MTEAEKRVTIDLQAMRHHIVEGQLVTLSSSLGVIQRVAVQVVGDVVLVCRRDEYDKAKLERRKPFTIGFRLADVIDDTMSV